MTEKEAYRILGVLPGSEKREIKKKYRKLMLQAHPDAGEAARDGCAHSAQEINAAYEFLTKEGRTGVGTDFGEDIRHGTKAKNAGWDAPVNENAYREREIFQYAEDCSGMALGSFCVAKGKYLWKAEEEFPLFLQSIYRCGKQLLDEIDSCLLREGHGVRQRVQAELTYLLAQQFMDGTALLRELARREGEDADGNGIYYVAAMLELSDPKRALGEGEAISPAGIKNHRLYVKNRAGQEMGYLSFRDDRLYYCIVPLLECKKIRVRMRAAKRRESKSRRSAPGYQNLHLWVKFCSAQADLALRDLNLEIENLLEEYKKGQGREP